MTEKKTEKVVAEVKAEEVSKPMSVWEAFRASLPKPPIRTRD